jgi:hypothetical protein
VIPYNLADGASSAPITVAADTPVFVIATNTTPGDVGTGYISLERHPILGGPVLAWSGVNMGELGGPSLTGGLASRPDTTMLTFDFRGGVTLRVADGNHFVVHNAEGSTQSGFIWILTAPM